MTIDPARKVAESRGGRCLSASCEPSAEELLWRCQERHQWQATFNKVAGGSWCPYCRGRYRTINDMQSLAAKRGGRCLWEDFLRMDAKLRWHAEKAITGKPSRRALCVDRGVLYALGGFRSGSVILGK